MAQKIIQMQMRHLYFNLKDLFSNRKGFVILTSLLRFKNKSREFREYVHANTKRVEKGSFLTYDFVDVFCRKGIFFTANRTLGVPK